MLKRRDFLKTCLLAAFASKASARELLAVATTPRREALHYQRLDQRRVGCRLCPRRCTISENNTGFCRGRKNIGGTLYSLGYAAPCAIHIDPIEKKPFFNYLPKSRSYSLASAGCNLRCKFCQNWDISQKSPLDTLNHNAPPELIVQEALQQGCKSIACTYTEPTTFFEYMLDIGKIAKAKGVRSVYHSNGYINPEPLQQLIPYLDAANIDLKGFSNGFYASICEAELEPVLATLIALKKGKVWVEITNLMIPGHNDSPGMVRSMAEWLVKNLGAETPLHLSRFFPLYQLSQLAPTPVATLERSREIAMQAGLHYVYIGNVPGHPANNTYCPKCGKMVARRSGFSVLELQMKGNRCAFCKERLAGNWTI